MKDRIKTLRKELHLTQQEFADKLGISRNNIASYETGKSNLGDSVISLICREFDVNDIWLRTGEGDIFLPDNSDNQLMMWVGRIMGGESDTFQKRLLNVLKSLSEEEWVLLETRAKELVYGTGTEDSK